MRKGAGQCMWLSREGDLVKGLAWHAKMQGGPAREASLLGCKYKQEGTHVEVTWEWLA